LELFEAVLKTKYFKECVTNNLGEWAIGKS